VTTLFTLSGQKVSAHEYAEIFVWCDLKGYKIVTLLSVFAVRPILKELNGNRSNGSTENFNQMFPD